MHNILFAMIAVLILAVSGCAPKAESEEEMAAKVNEKIVKKQQLTQEDYRIMIAYVDSTMTIVLDSLHTTLKNVRDSDECLKAAERTFDLTNKIIERRRYSKDFDKLIKDHVADFDTLTKDMFLETLSKQRMKEYDYNTEFKSLFKKYGFAV